MILDGCQGKKGPEIEEVICPNCGNTVELVSTDIFGVCEECGETVFTDRMDCARNCPQARECLGEKGYGRMINAKAQWRAQLEAQQDEDEW